MVSLCVEVVYGGRIRSALGLAGARKYSPGRFRPFRARMGVTFRAVGRPGNTTLREMLIECA